MGDGLVAIDGLDLAGSTYGNVAEGDYSGLFQFHPGADEAVKAGQAFAEGDYATAAIAMAGGATEMVSMVIDPIGTLASSVAGFLLDYMPPLPQMLDALAGNPDLVEGIGETWTNVAGAIETAAGDLNNALNRVMAGWSGLAAQAYNAACLGLIDVMYKAAYVYRCIGQGMAVASGVVEAVRAFTKEIIAELVGHLISWASQVAFTAGLGASWVIPQATARIADTVTDATKMADLLVEALIKAESTAELINNGLSLLTDVLSAMAEGIKKAQT